MEINHIINIMINRYNIKQYYGLISAPIHFKRLFFGKQELFSSLTKVVIYLNKICNYESYNASYQNKYEEVLISKYRL